MAYASQFGLVPSKKRPINLKNLSLSDGIRGFGSIS
jgi:hypothetical protein